MTQPQPFSSKFILQVCTLLLVLVALAGGYFEVLNENWQATYDHLKLQMATTSNSSANKNLSNSGNK